MMTIQKMALLLGHARNAKNAEKIEFARQSASHIERELLLWMKEEADEAVRKAQESQQSHNRNLGYSGPE